MRIVQWVGAVLLAAFTYTTLGRWQSDGSLWCDAARLAPDKPRALNNCALALLRNGSYVEALPLLDRALVTLETREPNRREALRATVLTNRFLVLYALRRTDDARQTLARVSLTDPRVMRYRAWLQP